MQIDLIKIGNSKGIRIPQHIIKQCGFEDSVDVTLEDHRLVLSAINKSRERWDDLFRAEGHAERYIEEPDEHELLTLQNKWDDEDWEW